MRTSLKNRVALGVMLAALVFAATHSIRAELPQAIGTWASLGATPESRVGAAAFALEDGRTLIAGGSVDGTATDSVVIFDPNDGSFSTVGHLLAARVGHTATLLNDGHVLIVGGTVGDLISADLELFDPVSGVSVLGGAIVQPRTGHAAAKLANGTVLVVGGTSTDGVLQSAEVYDPETGTTTPTVLPMLSPRTGASATTLIDGRVLVAGGNNGTADLASAEIFEPSSQIFEATTTQLSFARSGHAAVLVPTNNSVLIAGGSSNGVAVRTSDLFVPAEFPDPYSYGMGSFAQTGDLLTARARAIASPHIEGYAVAMGGGAPEAEVYRFPTIKTDKDDYAPGTKAIITGSGWDPNKDVTLLFQEDPAVHDDYVLHVTADDNGNIEWDRWAPEDHDLNVRFYLLAKQPTPSGERRAQITFTDSNPGAISVTPSPVIVAPGDVAAYTVSLAVGGNLNQCNVTLSASGLPAGASATFGTNPLVTTGAGNSPVTTSLNITTSGTTTPTGAFTITVSGVNSGAGCQGPGPTSGSATLQVEGVGTVTIGPQVGALTNGTAGSASYTVTVDRRGATGTTFNAALSITTSLPSGATASFSPSTVSFGSSDVSKASTLTITTTTATPAGTTGFTVQANNAAIANDSSSGNGTLTINNSSVNTTTTVTSSQNPSTFGQSVSFTASVAPASGSTAPTGTVQFVVDGVNFGSQATLSASSTNGVANSGATTTLNVSGSPHTVTANYSPTGIFVASSGSLVGGQIVHKATQGTVTVTAPSDVTFGTPATATATGGNGTGAFSFSAGASTGCTVVGDQVSVTNATGSCALTATRAGDDNYETSAASASFPVTLHKATQETVTVTAPSDVTFGTPATATATGGNGTGTFSFSAGASTGCTVVGDQVSVSNATGSCAITATRAGDNNYLDSAPSATFPVSLHKTDAIISVTPYSVPHDGNPHTAIGTAVGVASENLYALLDLSGTTHTNIGDYPGDVWIFSGDNNYNASTGTVHDRITYLTGFCLGEPGHQILQPINADGTSVVKRNSTVPAKFRVCDAAGNSVGTAGVVASFQLVSITYGTTSTSVTDVVSSTTTDTTFRWDPIGKLWIFNINTKQLDANKTYGYRITLNDGSTIQFQLGVR